MFSPARGTCGTTPSMGDGKALESPRFGTHRAHLHTQTVFPCVRGSPGRPVPFLSVSPLCARTPSTRDRITRAARVRAPSAENRSDVQKVSFSRHSSCLLYHRHATHIRASAFTFTLANTIAPYTRRTLRVCVFTRSLSRIHGATELRILHVNFPCLPSFVSSIVPEYYNPESEPQEPGHRKQKPGPA